MEAECARADLEDLRLDVWSKVKPVKRSCPKFITNISRVVSLAAIIVILAVVPVARDMNTPVVEQDKSKIVMAEPVIIIREEKLEAPSSSTPPVSSKSRKSAPVKRAQTVPTSHKAPVIKTVPYDQVFSLMQTGQRALKNNNSVVKIQ